MYMYKEGVLRTFHLFIIEGQFNAEFSLDGMAAASTAAKRWKRSRTMTKGYKWPEVRVV
jgi:hypothetical protein